MSHYLNNVRDPVTNSQIITVALRLAKGAWIIQSYMGRFC